MMSPGNKKRQLASVLVSVLLLISPLLAFLLVMPESVSAADAHLDAGGWEWHYDDTNDATKAILTRVVRVGTASTEVNIPTQLVAGINILSIAAGCFYDAEGAKITKVLSMPSTITTIGLNAFRNCVLMTSVIIGSGVTSMGVQGFYQCSALTSITIPNSVTSIENWAFYGCTLMTSVTIGTGVTSIGTNAFEQCTHLTSITIPNNVISIGGTAFGHCTVLVSVTIGSGVTNIGTFAFSYCSALVSITIPNGVTSAGTYLFDHCIKLTSVTIGSGLTSLADDTFQYCSVLASITIPNTITSIGIYAFYQCVALTSVTLGSGTTIIGANAFDRCTALPSITIPSTVTSIGGYAFYYCSALTSIIIPNSVTSLGTYAFDHCTALASVTIGSGVTSLAVQVFSYCSALTSIIIPNGIISIGAYEFYLCTALTSVTIGTGVTTIAIQAFWGCSVLTSIKFLGLVAPTSVGAGWITGTPSGIRGHAYAASNFPTPGNAFYGLIMGDYTPIAPIFTSTPKTGAWEDHAYSYSPTCDQAITTWGLLTNASWLSQNLSTGTISGTPDNTNSMKNYYANIIATNEYGTCYQNFTVTVANYIPHMTTTPDAWVYAGNTYYYNASFDDFSFGGAYSTITSNCPDSYTFNLTTGKLYFLALTAGTYWFDIAFTDNSGAANETQDQVFNVEILAGFTFTSSQITGAWEDHAYSYTPTCSEVVTTWGLSTNASWISQTPADGNVHGTPDNINSMHSYYVHISATNVHGTIWQNYTVTVANYAPHITTTPSAGIWMSKTFDYNASADDGGAYGGTFGASITTNLTGAYSWVSSTGKLNFVASTKGSFWFNISFNDNSGAGNATTYQNFTVTVAKPYFTSTPITDAWEDHAYSYVPAVNTTVTAWGRTTNGAWINQNSGTGEIYGTPTNTYSEHSYWVNVSATTQKDGTVYQNYSIFVHNYAPHFTSTPNPFGYNTTTYSYTANFDDKSVGGAFIGITTNYSHAYSFDLPTGLLSFYVDLLGLYWFNITCTDNSGASNATAYQNFTIDLVTFTFTSTPVTSAWEDHAYSYTPTCSETVISWQLDTNASWLSQTPANGNVHGTPDNTNSVHSYYVNIKATTALYGWLWQNYTVTVDNYIPHFTSSPKLYVNWTQVYYYNSSFDDSTVGGTWGAITTNYTAAYTWNVGNGKLQFTANVICYVWFNFTVNDNSGAANATTYQNWTIYIFKEFVITSTPVTSAWEDHLYQSQFTANKTSTWTKTSNASWISIGGGTGFVSGTPVDTNANRWYWVNVTAHHGIYIDWRNYTVTVANNPPVWTSTPATTGTVLVLYQYYGITTDLPWGGLFSFTTDATFVGMSLNPLTGLLEILPTTAGTFWFNLRYIDHSGVLNGTITQNWTITFPSIPGGGGGGGPSVSILADFTFSVGGMLLGIASVQRIYFTSSTTGTNIVSWSWNFGDGQTSSQQNPSHDYREAGEYTVVLTISDLAGNTATITHVVKVSPTAAQSVIAIVISIVLFLVGAVGVALSKSGTTRIAWASVVFGAIVIFVVLYGGI
jgi:hypothetical protein